MEKKYLRARMLEKRKSLNLLEVQGRSHEIAQRLWLLPEYRQAKTVLAYLPVRQEIDTVPIIKTAWRQQKRILVPVCQAPDKRLILSHLQNLDQLEEGTFKIPEPKKEYICPVPSPEVDLVILPGVAFDRQGGRIGYGAGYFDRFLVTLRDDCPIVALAYEFQLLPFVPAEKHDVPVDIIVTEERLLYTNKYTNKI